MENTQTKIRWLSAVAIVFLITATAVIVNSHPYEFKVSTDENTQKAITSMSNAVAKQGQEIIDLNVALAVCNERLNQTRTP